MISARDGYDTGDSAAAVVTHVRRLIDHGALGPGARLPPERDLAQQIGVSRPTVRAGLRTLAALADEVAGLFASLNERQVFLVHDINFHRGVAAASRNPIVASLVEMVSALYYERRRMTAARAVDRDLRDAADAHRQIYQAIRARDVERARRAMHDHLIRARSYQAKEASGEQSSPLKARGSGVKGEGSPKAQRPAPARERRTDAAERRTPNLERRTSTVPRAAR